MNWWLSESAIALLGQVNARWPNRDRASDGTIGDPSHAATKSDHNPDPTSDPPGVVRALDIDADLGSKGDATGLANQLREHAETDGRIAYIIYAGHITSGTYPATFWKWRKYTGDDPHFSHIHISFNHTADHSPRPFRLPILENDDMPLSDADVQRIAEAVWNHKIDQPVIQGEDPRPSRRAAWFLPAILDRVRGGN